MLENFYFHNFRVFRIVHAPIFLKSFASDRRHMKDPSGSWTATPPSYEVITAEGKSPFSSFVITANYFWRVSIVYVVESRSYGSYLMRLVSSATYL